MVLPDQRAVPAGRVSSRQGGHLRHWRRVARAVRSAGLQPVPEAQVVEVEVVLSVLSRGGARAGGVGGWLKTSSP